MRRIALNETPEQGADVVLLDRKVIEALGAVGEKNTSLISLLMWMGFRQARIPYVKGERVAGESGWTRCKRMKLAIDSLVSFSSLPIRLTWLCGVVFLAAAGLWTAVVVAGRLFGWGLVSAGLAAILAVQLLGFGLLLTFLGILGEYVWRAYDEVRGRPRYLIERLINPPASRFVAEARPERPSAAAGESGQSEPVELNAEARS